jgi:hypothetical protein
MDKYFIIPVFGCVEPQKLIGPFKTFDAMRKRAVKVRKAQDDNDAIFYLCTHPKKRPCVDSFTDDQLEID